MRTGLIFGVIEALTPLIGWAAGVAASQYVSAVDHWIAFVLLAGVGLHMALHADNGPEGKASSSSLWGGSYFPRLLSALRCNAPETGDQ
ncbi:membrane protein [Rhodovulum sulfidophilum]|uniref:Membrane protein n=1 Tax=Rhodovulum sulfidophilum TaxID=35806 RepID=A0A0D6B3B0_RHOSU|nr:membrane protein [Rhodovulum sulfidophilum]